MFFLIWCGISLKTLKINNLLLLSYIHVVWLKRYGATHIRKMVTMQKVLVDCIYSTTARQLHFQTHQKKISIGNNNSILGGNTCVVEIW